MKRALPGLALSAFLFAAFAGESIAAAGPRAEVTHVTKIGAKLEQNRRPYSYKDLKQKTYTVDPAVAAKRPVLRMKTVEKTPDGAKVTTRTYKKDAGADDRRLTVVETKVKFPKDSGKKGYTTVALDERNGLWNRPKHYTEVTVDHQNNVVGASFSDPLPGAFNRSRETHSETFFPGKPAASRRDRGEPGGYTHTKLGTPDGTVSKQAVNRLRGVWPKADDVKVQAPAK